jgi:D-3-phosphoglycerate dehydrogenase / 2-oxoglutarate reductase
MSRVLIAPVALADLQAPFVGALKKAGLELVYHGHPAQMNEEQLLAALNGIEASLAGSEPYTARVLAAHPQLKVIARVGVGYDTVDVDAATKHGAAVCFAPGTNQGSVAEHTFAMMLAWTRNLINQHNQTKAGGWPRGALLPLRGNTLGIAGLGRIGKAVATRAQAFEMNVIAHDAAPDTAWAAKHNVPLVSWEELLRRSDFLTIHVPALPQTHRMINAKSLALMKPTAVLVNTARGAVVDEPALVEALKKKQIAGALLDVFDVEPPGKHPLLGLDNVIVTPHAAGVDLRSRDDMALSAAEAIASLYKGEWPAEKVVNPQVRERFRWR